MDGSVLNPKLIVFRIFFGSRSKSCPLSDTIAPVRGGHFRTHLTGQKCQRSELSDNPANAKINLPKTFYTIGLIQTTKSIERFRIRRKFQSRKNIYFDNYFWFFYGWKLFFCFDLYQKKYNCDWETVLLQEEKWQDKTPDNSRWHLDSGNTLKAANTKVTLSINYEKYTIVPKRKYTRRRVCFTFQLFPRITKKKPKELYRSALDAISYVCTSYVENFWILWNFHINSRAFAIET